MITRGNIVPSIEKSATGEVLELNVIDGSGEVKFRILLKPEDAFELSVNITGLLLDNGLIGNGKE